LTPTLSPRSGGRGSKTSTLLLAFSRRRRGLPLELRHELVEEHRHLVRRLRADALPVLDAVRLERDGLVVVRHLWIVGAKFLDHAAVVRLPAVDGNEAIKLPVFPAHRLHPNANRHVLSPNARISRNRECSRGLGGCQG